MAEMTSNIICRRPALRYYGGKWRLAPWIMQFFPEHDCYVEPFGGGASVLLRKAPAFIDVYNDIYGDVVNFFRVLRERPEQLIRAITLTPYSRLEYLEAQDGDKCIDNVEAARRFYVWSCQGRGRGGIKESGGWRVMSRKTRSKTPVDDWNNLTHLWTVANRLKDVQIEYDHAEVVIKRYDTKRTLFYVDPPYVQSTGSSRWAKDAYACEYYAQDHRRLAALLQSLDGMVIVSGYESALYAELFADWNCVKRKVKKAKGNDAVELLFLSPNNCNKSLSLF